MHFGLHLEQLRQKMRKRHLYADAERNAEHPSQQPQQQRLQKVDLHDLPGASTQGLHDRDGVQPLLQVRSHRHADSDCAQHQRDQAHQGKQARRAVESSCQRRIRLAIVDHASLGQQLFQALAECRHRRIRYRAAVAPRGQLEEISLSRVAARSKQPARVQPLA